MCYCVVVFSIVRVRFVLLLSYFLSLLFIFNFILPVPYCKLWVCHEAMLCALRMLCIVYAVCCLLYVRYAVMSYVARVLWKSVLDCPCFILCCEYALFCACCLLSLVHFYALCYQLWEYCEALFCVSVIHIASCLFWSSDMWCLCCVLFVVRDVWTVVVSLLCVACCEGLFCVFRVLSCELSVLCIVSYTYVVNCYYVLCVLRVFCFRGVLMGRFVLWVCYDGLLHAAFRLCCQLSVVCSIFSVLMVCWSFLCYFLSIVRDCCVLCYGVR
jgi:hypothetical protein